MKLKYLGKETGLVVPKEIRKDGGLIYQNIGPGAIFECPPAEGAKLLERFNLPFNKKTGMKPSPRFEVVESKPRSRAKPKDTKPAVNAEPIQD
jgi:hypothetical protein